MENKKFYNDYYSKEVILNDNTLELKLYKLLKKYEKNRYEVISEIIDGLGLENTNILDIGCGEGQFFNYLKRKYNLFGIDISKVRLSKIGVSDLNIIEGDLDETFGFENDFFEVVTSMSVLEHVFSVEHQLNEVFRVLKKGGTFILEVPNVGFLPNRLRLLFGNTPITGNWAEAWDDNHLHYFTKNDLKKYLEKFGFKIEKISGAGIFANLRNFMPSLLCGNLIFICKKIN